MRRAGLSEEEIEYEIRGMEINKILAEGTKEEVDAIMPEFMERARLINQRLVEKYDSAKKR